MRNISDKFVQKFKTHIPLKKNNFLENLAVYEIMWKKHFTARQATDDNITRRLRFAPWISKATDTLRIR